MLQLICKMKIRIPVTKLISGPKVIKLFSSMNFNMLINVKMLTIVDILTFISMMNKLSDSLKIYYVM